MTSGALLGRVASQLSTPKQRDWTDETKRHDRVINALEGHCSRLENTPIIPGTP